MKINFNTIRKKLGLDSLQLEPKISNSDHKMKIDEAIDENYEAVKVNHVGLTTPFGVEGAVILKTYDGREFPISAFSGEVARHI